MLPGHIPHSSHNPRPGVTINFGYQRPTFSKPPRSTPFRAPVFYAPKRWGRQRYRWWNWGSPGRRYILWIPITGGSTPILLAWAFFLVTGITLFFLLDNIIPAIALLGLTALATVALIAYTANHKSDKEEVTRSTPEQQNSKSQENGRQKESGEANNEAKDKKETKKEVDEARGVNKEEEKQKDKKETKEATVITDSESEQHRESKTAPLKL